MKANKNYILKAYQNYFFGDEGNGGLCQSVLNIPEEPLISLAETIKAAPKNSRIFFMGNGGSFDNACYCSATMMKAGVLSNVPAMETGYSGIAVEEGYELIYKKGLELSGLTKDDIIIGLSGSGNSENICRALNFALEKNATIYCFGGRDGGKMAKICGAQNSIIVNNEIMEAIEDLHLIVLRFLVQLIQDEKQTLEKQKSDFTTKLTSFFEKNNEDAFSCLVNSVLNTINEESRLFVLGHTVGANHFRADMMRGATNTIPIRGISAPELTTINSFQATANDDGLDFTLIKGLVKNNPTKNDFALLFSLPGAENMQRLCEDELRERGVSFIKIGDIPPSDKAIDLSFFKEFDIDFAITLLGHATSTVINGFLMNLWKIEPLELQQLEGLKKNRKLDKKATLNLENTLRKNGVLSEERMVTFCYGKTFSAIKPPDCKASRSFY
ncbi:MAG: hypothetical protein HQK84_11700 [Nitrospinae bacterium]|nr:hypothetical protein [Nitrospinota bacterium]